MSVVLTPIVRLNVGFCIPTLDGRQQPGVVLRRRISVTLSPLGQRVIQRRGVTAVAGNAGRVYGPPMGSCENGAAQPCS